MKCGNLNRLKPSGPLQACNGTDLPLPILNSIIRVDTKKRELLKTPTKIEEIQEKNLLAEIEPLQLAF